MGAPLCVAWLMTRCGVCVCAGATFFLPYQQIQHHHARAQVMLRAYRFLIALDRTYYILLPVLTSE